MKDFRGKWVKNPKTIKDPEGEIPTIEIVNVDGELCYSPNNRKAISKEDLLRDWVPAEQVIQDPYATIKVNTGADLQSDDPIKQFEEVEAPNVYSNNNITLGKNTKEVTNPVIKTTEDDSVEGMLIKSLSMAGLSSEVTITTDITIPVDIQILSKLINESPNINAEILVSKLLDKNIDKLKADITKGLIESLDKNQL